MRRLLLLLIIFAPFQVLALEPLKICDFGDIQLISSCYNETSAWDHGEAAVQYIVDHPSLCDVVLFPGDIVLAQSLEDCWCATQTPVPPEECVDLVNPDTGENCPFSTSCNDPEGTVCDGGTPGTYCEWTRVQTLVNMLKAVDIPVIVTSGNHDADTKDIWKNCSHEFHIYNSYFGAGHLSDDFDSSGVFHHEVDCSLAADGKSEQADSTWHVLTAAGTQWLLIGLAWTSLDYSIGETPYIGIDPPTLEWIRGVIDAHLGMPTIFVTHCGVGNICGGTWPAEWTAFYENAWCGDSLQWWKWCAVSAIYKQLLFDPVRAPQILGVIGGHIRYNAFTVSQNSLYPTFGTTFDYTDHIAGFPAWQSNDNGGGGIIQFIKVDPVKGAITTKGYSPYEGEWVGVFGDEPSSHYELTVPMCADDARFHFPASACPQREPSPKCCTK